ncbi:MAG: hypothetical protein JXM73_02835 [Anaerolineae bacterium]|nr:hypothetical protein [Anaerolineae bacterium]
MIPVEYFWFALMFMLGIIGAVRGLTKELGATTILTLSLFVLKFAWNQFLPTITTLAESAPLGLSLEMVKAIVFSIAIVFVAIISYEGIVLQFPFKDLKGLGKGFFGFLGGLLNGYVIIGTIWDVFAHADYFAPKASIVSQSLTSTHQAIVQFLPVTFVNQYILLAIGMVLLLAIVIK